MTSLVNFFKQFDAKITKSEIVDTHGGSIRIYIKKDKRAKVEKSVTLMLKEEDNFGIKKFGTYKKFGEKVYKIRENVRENLKKIRKENKVIIGYGAPAKATTALNFFGIFAPGINLLCLSLLSSTIKSISFEIPKKFKAVVAFAGAP